MLGQCLLSTHFNLLSLYIISLQLVMLCIFQFFFYMLSLCFSDEKAQVDDEDKAVMNLIRSDDWVYSFCLSVSNNIISTVNLNFHFLFRF